MSIMKNGRMRSTFSRKLVYNVISQNRHLKVYAKHTQKDVCINGYLYIVEIRNPVSLRMYHEETYEVSASGSTGRVARLAVPDLEM
jgi:hypothetical protein